MSRMLKTVILSIISVGGGLLGIIIAQLNIFFPCITFLTQFLLILGSGILVGITMLFIVFLPSRN